MESAGNLSCVILRDFDLSDLVKSPLGPYLVTGVLILSFRNLIFKDVSYRPDHGIQLLLHLFLLGLELINRFSQGSQLSKLSFTFVLSFGGFLLLGDLLLDLTSFLSGLIKLELD